MFLRRWFSRHEINKRIAEGPWFGRHRIGKRIAEGEITLDNMSAGQVGVVTQLTGWPGFVRHLESLGIRPGKKITKVNSVFMRGPVIVEVDRARVAVGHGMARKIMVTLEDK